MRGYANRNGVDKIYGSNRRYGQRNRQESTITGSSGNGEMRREPRTRLVIDDTTIYEIDLDCLECLEKNKAAKEGKM